MEVWLINHGPHKMRCNTPTEILPLEGLKDSRNTTRYSDAQLDACGQGMSTIGDDCSRRRPMAISGTNKNSICLGSADLSVWK